MKVAMHRAGLDAGRLAPLLHVDRQTIGRWTRDKGNPNPIVLERFAEICGVPADWFISQELVTDNRDGDPDGSPAPLTSTDGPRRTRGSTSNGRKPVPSEDDIHSYRDKAA